MPGDRRELALVTHDRAYLESFAQYRQSESRELHMNWFACRCNSSRESIRTINIHAVIKITFYIALHTENRQFPSSPFHSRFVPSPPSRRIPYQSCLQFYEPRYFGGRTVQMKSTAPVIIRALARSGDLYASRKIKRSLSIKNSPIHDFKTWISDNPFTWRQIMRPPKPTLRIPDPGSLGMAYMWVRRRRLGFFHFGRTG